MGVKLFSEPKLRRPDMIVGWPGIGNIGIITADTLRQSIDADELGVIEPWEFFYPGKVIIRSGILRDMEFPDNRFYYKQLPERDLILFIAEEQPVGGGRVYAEGEEAYRMANLVLDVAEKFDCRRLYTSGAAVALTHHEARPRVWAAATDVATLADARRQENTIRMSAVEGHGILGNITGLNGLLIGAARKRGFEGMCLMGEIPDYLSRVPFPFPQASRSVLEVLASLLDIEIDYHPIDEMIEQLVGVTTNVFQQFPENVRERIEQRRKALDALPGKITEEDERWLKDHIDDFFRKEERGQ